MIVILHFGSQWLCCYVREILDELSLPLRLTLTVLTILPIKTFYPKYQTKNDLDPPPTEMNVQGVPTEMSPRFFYQNSSSSSYEPRNFVLLNFFLLNSKQNINYTVFCILAILKLRKLSIGMSNFTYLKKFHVRNIIWQEEKDLKGTGCLKMKTSA